MTNMQRWKNKLNEIAVLSAKVPEDQNERVAQARKLKTMARDLFTLSILSSVPDHLRVAQTK